MGGGQRHFSLRKAIYPDPPRAQIHLADGSSEAGQSGAGHPSGSCRERVKRVRSHISYAHGSSGTGQAGTGQTGPSADQLCARVATRSQIQYANVVESDFRINGWY